MNAKISRKGIRVAIEKGLSMALAELDITDPSKKTMKQLRRFSKKFATTLKKDIIAKVRRAEKTLDRLAKKEKLNKKRVKAARS